MSGSIGFKDKFCNRFHIGKVQRKPLREEVSNLRARAMRLPQADPMVKNVMSRLDDAKEVLFKEGIV